MEITNLIQDVVRNLNAEVSVKISNGHRGYRSCISPSLWTLKKEMNTQAKKFFDPVDMKEAGLITPKEFESLMNARAMDVGGYMNCAIGTVIHALVLPELETALRNMDVDAQIEIPVWSHETCVFGTCDLVVFDKDGGIRVFDLKTCGEKILERGEHVEENYLRQLYAYAATLECMFPDKFIKQLSIISLCKIPNSTGYDKAGNRVKLPLVAQCDVSYEDLDKQYHTKLEELITETKKIATALKNKTGKTYWILEDEKEPNFA